MDFVPFSEDVDTLIPGDGQLGETHTAPSLSVLCGRSGQYCSVGVIWNCVDCNGLGSGSMHLTVQGKS